MKSQRWRQMPAQYSHKRRFVQGAGEPASNELRLVTGIIGALRALAVHKRRAIKRNKETRMFQRDFPTDAREMWDVIAKALMIHLGGSVCLSQLDLREAAATQAEIELTDDGSIHFRVDRQ
jgi:hypothetical protein